MHHVAERPYFIPEIDAAWKVAYRGSEVLSWKSSRGGSAVDVIVIGKLGKDNLQSAITDFQKSSMTFRTVWSLFLTEAPCRLYVAFWRAGSRRMALARPRVTVHSSTVAQDPVCLPPGHEVFLLFDPVTDFHS